MDTSKLTSTPLGQKIKVRNYSEELQYMKEQNAEFNKELTS